MSMNLAEKYRPQTFSDVWGQPSAVRALSNLVHRKVAVGVLLFGAVGSGKTTMARIYGRGLNCSAPAATDGSPCWSCAYCAESDQAIGFYEYDVPARGGDWKAIEKWLKDNDRNPLNPRGFVVYFIDEAHGLGRDAIDALLKRIERADRRHVFIFATTDPSKLSAALKSRLIELEVRPLDVETSVRFLTKVARDEGIKCEPSVLRFLAGLKKGHPRNLLFGLEQLQALGRMSIIEARRHFDVDHVDVLRRYISALGELDFGGAMLVLEAWNEEGPDKIRYVQALLLSIYFNEILRRPLRVNPLLDSLTADELAQFIDAFLLLFGASSPKQLVPQWLEMMRFWQTSEHVLDGEAALLRFVNFHMLLAELAEGRSASRAVAKAPTPKQCAVRPPALNSGSPQLVDGPEAGFVSYADVARVINFASQLPQLHGVWFNARAKLGPHFAQDMDERKARELHRQFWSEFEDRIDVQAYPTFARLTVAEREAGGFVSYSALHIPSDGDGSLVEELKEWAPKWPGKGRGRALISEFDVRLETAPARMVKVHWDFALRLCGGMNSGFRERDAKGNECDLRKLIGLPKNVQRVPLRLLYGPMIEASGALSDAAIGAASRLSMGSISAFDAKAWNYLRNGWEREEYRDRTIEARNRAQKLRIAEFEGASSKELELLQAGWEFPQDRPRQWRGWWQAGAGV